MEIKRTANAGVLLRLDGKSVLLDGVCGEVRPYPATPAYLRQQLLEEKPDAVAFTHSHMDHCDPLFVSQYLQNSAGPILGPADIPCSRQEAVRLADVTITPVQSHHLGKTEDIPHQSYVIQGSRCVWFMGDASPERWQERTDLPRPDVLIAPYAFATGHGWKVTKALSPAVVILLHLPKRSEDCYGLWNAVEQTVGSDQTPTLFIPDMGERITLKECQKC